MWCFVGDKQDVLKRAVGHDLEWESMHEESTDDLRSVTGTRGEIWS